MFSQQSLCSCCCYRPPAPNDKCCRSCLKRKMQLLRRSLCNRLRIRPVARENRKRNFGRKINKWSPFEVLLRRLTHPRVGLRVRATTYLARRKTRESRCCCCCDCKVHKQQLHSNNRSAPTTASHTTTVSTMPTVSPCSARCVRASFRRHQPRFRHACYPIGLDQKNISI